MNPLGISKETFLDRVKLLSQIAYASDLSFSIKVEVQGKFIEITSQIIDGKPRLFTREYKVQQVV